MLHSFCNRIIYRCVDYTKFRSSETILQALYDYDGNEFLQQIVDRKLESLKTEDKIDKRAVAEIT
jgi:hypothetical protein